MSQIEQAKENQFLLQEVAFDTDLRAALPLLSGAIEGATVYYHTLPEGDRLFYERTPALLRTFFLLDGTLRVTNGSHAYTLAKKDCYVADIDQDMELCSDIVSRFLEIQWRLTDEDRTFLAEKRPLPLFQVYEDCAQYKEPLQSPKVISRAVIGHHALPRFCMGSIQSYGPDRKASHAHPLLEQFFFSFPENDIDLLIDGKIQSFGGNTLFYVPLASDHGVEVADGKAMHYLWIDFIIDPKGVDYLDEVHNPTVVKESYDSSGTLVSEAL